MGNFFSAINHIGVRMIIAVGFIILDTKYCRDIQIVPIRNSTGRFATSTHPPFSASAFLFHVPAKQR